MHTMHIRQMLDVPEYISFRNSFSNSLRNSFQQTDSEDSEDSESNGEHSDALLTRSLQGASYQELGVL